LLYGDAYYSIFIHEGRTVTYQCRRWHAVDVYTRQAAQQG
jgi:hypothetical protein